MDDRYLDKSGDDTYKSVQRIVIKDKDINLLLSALEKLGSGIDSGCKNA